MSLTQQLLAKWKELVKASDYTELHEEDDWVINIDLAKDDPDHFVIITYRNLDGQAGKARVARKPLLQRMKELENKNNN